MLTYQIRERVFRLAKDQALEFPADVKITFVFGPEQPFGESAGGGRTAVAGVGASVLFNANTGQHAIESKVPLSPLEVTIEEPGRTIVVEGRRLSVTERFASLEALDSSIASLAFAIPWLLSVDFADPPYLERVFGSIGGVDFRWELKQWSGGSGLTTQEQQEQRVATAWRRLSVVSPWERRRLLGALHYFHVALRLERAGVTAGEFLAEVLLNLCKVLECLFPPSSRDAVREGLAALGYSQTEVERDFIPVMLLRSQIDVGHIQLALFKRQHLTTLHAFVEGAERKFQLLLQRVLERIEAGEWDVTPYGDGTPDRDILETIERIADSIDATERAGE